MTQTPKQLKRAGEKIKYKAKYGALATVFPWKCGECGANTALEECLQCRMEETKKRNNDLRREDVASQNREVQEEQHYRLQSMEKFGGSLRDLRRPHD